MSGCQASVALGVVLAACAPRPTPTETAPPAPIVPVAPSASAVAEPACAPAARVAIDVERWKRELTSAGSEAARNRLLDSAALAPVADSSGPEPLELAGIDVLEATFGSVPGADRVIHVRYHRTDEGQEQKVSRIQALRRSGTGYCALASGMNVDQRSDERPCLEVEREWPVTLALVHLTSPTEHALRVIQTSGRCGGCGRGATEQVSLHRVAGDGLSSVFETTTYDAWYQGCPFPPVKYTFGDLRFSGGFPREIVTTHEVVCEADVEPDNPDKAPCTPEAERRRHRFQNGSYTKISSRPLEVPRRSRLAIEDSDFSDARAGAGWRERCVSHLEKGALAHARAACEQGLGAGASRELRGALHQTLALIEERDGHPGAACRELEQSLALRPRDSAVLAKRAALGCASTPSSRPKP